MIARDLMRPECRELSNGLPQDNRSPRFLDLLALVLLIHPWEQDGQR